MNLNTLCRYLNETLQVEKFKDYCPNGLQVEGKQNVQKVVTGVTASLDFLQAAHAANADAVLVHHGYFWKGESEAVTGIKMRRLKFLLEHEINLFAYHLPLDAHSDFGNNVMLGKVLGLEIAGWLDDHNNMIAWANLEKPQTLKSFGEIINRQLGRQPLLIGDGDKLVRTVAWCTGAAQGYIDNAIAHDIDVFVSGEVSEQTVHSVRESNTAFIAAGHHATERYGIQALGESLAGKYNIEHEFIDIDNPI